MAKEITDMQIKLISLVAKGANNKTIIYKNENFNEILRVDFSKTDEEQGVVYGIVYAPDEVDSQGEFASAREIKKAAYSFLKSANLAGCVDTNHDFNAVDAFVCESWIVKSKDEFFDEVGAWAVGIKIEDENLKKRIKNGEISGLSMYGSGIIKSENKDEKSTILSALKEFFGSEKNIVKGEKMDETKVAQLLKEANAKNDEKIKELEKSLNELNAKFNDFSKELSKSKQDETIKKQMGAQSTSKGIL